MITLGPITPLRADCMGRGLARSGQGAAAFITPAKSWKKGRRKADLTDHNHLPLSHTMRLYSAGLFCASSQALRMAPMMSPWLSRREMVAEEVTSASIA